MYYLCTAMCLYCCIVNVHTHWLLGMLPAYKCNCYGTVKHASLISYRNVSPQTVYLTHQIQVHSDEYG